MRFFLLISIFITIASCSPLKQIQEKLAKGLIVEKYQVKRKEPLVKEGHYTQLYKGVKLEEGNYSNNKKTGVWNYYDYNGKLNFSGVFENDLKQGLWTYYYKRNLTSKVYYNNGILDSVFGYHENGLLAYETRFTADSTGYGKSYYKNGQLKSSFSLKNRQKNGVYTQYFENGKLHRETEYKDGDKVYIIQVLDPTGKSIDGGNLKEGNGSYIQFFDWEQGKEPALKVSIKENYENGLLNGSAKYYRKNGKLETEGLYKDGYKTGYWKLYDENGSEINVNYDASYKSVKIVELTGCYAGEEDNAFVQPEFQGGENERVNFIVKNIVYPQEAVAKKVQGTVYVNFIITQTGELESFKIIKSVNKQLDEEVIKLLKKMPRWNPGLNQGVPVRVWFNMPIKYTL
ncbi:MAG TPA: TonB family protein [Bacteroidia bacterium]|nr:TonB family protein [Bacteroidia bacterium]